MSIGLALGLHLGRGTGHDAAPAEVATYWWDPAYDSRLLATLTNDEAVPLYDHLVTITIPPGTSVDADSLRVTEVSVSGSTVVPWAEPGRYGTNKVNRHFTAPASTDGATITAKLLGKWAAGETRYLRCYWDSTSAIAPLGSDAAILRLAGPRWTVAMTAGTAGDLYRLVVNGVNCDYTMQSGDTATIIAAALVVQINALANVAATASSGTVTFILRTDLAAIDLTLANTGSTQPTKVVIGTRPNFWTVQRVGPDTEVLSYNPAMGVPYGTGTSPAVRVGFGWNNSHLAQTMSYKVNGDGTTYDANTASVSGATQTKHGAHITGALTYDTRAGDVDWLCTYACDWENKIVTGRKSDDTGPDTLNKQAHVFHVTITYTCNRAYTPATTGTTLLTLMFQSTGFGGDVTIANGNKHANWSAPLATGTITDYATTGLAPAASLDTIIGANTGQHAMGMLVTAVAFAGFGSQSPGLAWTSDASAYAYLGITGLSTGSTIPQGATITASFILIDAATNNPTTTGDGLLADEMVTLMQGIAASPTATGSVQSPDASTLRQTLELAADHAVEGAQWFIDHALAFTGRADNYAFSVDPDAPSTVTYGDDNDSNYGVGHMLHGLCLRYRRTQDAALIPLIEAYVQMLLTAESELVSLYGSWWSGATSYWFWPGPNAETTTYLNDQGFSPGADIDSTDGGPTGSQTYEVGQIRRATSIDQLHMQAHGLYAYCYILRNESAITANTTLYANACAYVGRMATFETAHFNAANRKLHNLDDLINGGGTPSHALSVSVADTYQGAFWPSWQITNTTPFTPDASANSTLDNTMSWVYSPDVTADTIANHIRGRTHDFVGIDWSRHDMVTDPAVATRGIVGTYPPGWMAKGLVSTVRDFYESPRTTAGNGVYPNDLHYLKIASGSNADVMYGRAAQRLICMVIGEWLKPGMTVDVEMSGATVVRSITMRDAIDDTARTLANYLLHPSTKTSRRTAAGYLPYGLGGDWDPKRIDSVLSGYWMMAVEVWLLLDSGADVADYYRKAAV